MNVFLINTPHQLINAIEARHYFDLSDCLLIIDISDTYNASSFETLMGETAWEKVKFIKPFFKLDMLIHNGERNTITAQWKRFYNDYMTRKQIDTIIRSISNVENVFIGNYFRKLMRHFANRINSENLYLLDDGTRTVDVNKIRWEIKSKYNKKHIFNGNRRIRDVFLRLDIAHPKNVVFFTAYDIKPTDDDKIEKNEYACLKNIARTYYLNDEIYFLGQPLVEGGLVKLEVYVQYLQRVIHYFKNEKFVYLPHKNERMDKINYIENCLNMKIKYFDVPIEYQMSARGTRPKILASFFSSAMENSRIIFGELITMKLFVIAPNDIVNRDKEFVASIYTYYKSKQNAGFEVLQI